MNIQREQWRWVFLFGVFLMSLWLCTLRLDWFSSQSVYPRSVLIGNTKYSLEIADTEQERMRGLSEREYLCQNCALLFIFPEEERPAFWMKDMRFSIDIIWLSGDSIVGIERNLSPSSKGIFRPERAADKVIEINAGGAEDSFLGDVVQYEY